MAVWINK